MIDPSLVQRLIDAISRFEIIDAHEHLSPEQVRLDQQVDVFTLFQHYTAGDLRVAGMPPTDYQLLFDRRLPLETRWGLFKPYWERIRTTSYARAALIAARHFYGVEDINDQTYVALSEAIQRNNTPGLYERVLGQACNIRLALTQCSRTDLNHPRLLPVMPMMYPCRTWKEIAHPVFDPTATVQTLDDYVDALRAYVRRVKAEGAVGLKTASVTRKTPDRQAALEAFAALRDGKIQELPEFHVLFDWVSEQVLTYGAEQGLVICVHTGYWGDFRNLDPLHFIPVIERHPNVRFDVYHLGYPWMRESLMLGKAYANVWLNMCWTHIIAQKFATEALDEAIDLIPQNKLIAFGGDYAAPVEKTYGHLVMAREDVARALAAHIERGQLCEEQAVDLAHKWFWDNPVALYNLKV